VVIDPPLASTSDTVTITATVRNFSDVPAENVVVEFYRGNPAEDDLIGDDTIEDLDRDAGPATASITWTVTGAGEQKIYAVIDPDGELDEMHDEGHIINNNMAYGLVQVGAASYFDMGVAEAQPYDSISYGQGDTLTVTLYVALASLDATARLDLHHVAAGGLSVVGNPFEVVATQGSEHREWGDPIPGFDLKLEADDPPAVMGISYHEAALHGRDGADLRLYRCTETDRESGRCTGDWEEAHRTCGVEGDQPLYQIQRFPEDNLIAVPVCQTGVFALSDVVPQLAVGVFLPVVLRNH
jgi:hypothetical protein